MTAPWENLGIPGHTNRGHEWAALLALVGDPPMARLRAQSATSMANAAFTSVNFDTEEYDNYNGHSTATNTSRYTCRVAGRYLLAGAIAWTNSTTGNQRAQIWAVNGIALAAAQTAWPSAGAIEKQYPARTITTLLAVNDYVELQGYQDTGGALNTSVGSNTVYSSMDVRWVGRF